MCYIIIIVTSILIGKIFPWVYFTYYIRFIIYIISYLYIISIVFCRFNLFNFYFSLIINYIICIFYYVVNLFYLFGEDFTIGNIPKILSMWWFTVINFVLDSLRLISGMLMYEKSSVTGMALLFGRDIEPKKSHNTIWMYTYMWIHS